MTLKVLLSSRKVPGDRYRALALHESDHLGYRILGRDRDQHVDVVRHQVSFHDLALMLSRQIVEDCPEVFAQVPINHLPAELGDEDYVVFALPAA